MITTNSEKEIRDLKNENSMLRVANSELEIKNRRLEMENTRLRAEDKPPGSEVRYKSFVTLGNLSPGTGLRTIVNKGI